MSETVQFGNKLGNSNINKREKRKRKQNNKEWWSWLGGRSRRSLLLMGDQQKKSQPHQNDKTKCPLKNFKFNFLPN